MWLKYKNPAPPPVTDIEQQVLGHPDIMRNFDDITLTEDELDQEVKLEKVTPVMLQRDDDEEIIFDFIELAP